MKKLSDIIRSLREKNGFLLRQVASEIQIDQALLSKIERNERLPTKEQVIRLAKFYRTDEQILLIAFLSEKQAKIITEKNKSIKKIKIICDSIAID